MSKKPDAKKLYELALLFLNTPEMQIEYTDQMAAAEKESGFPELEYESERQNMGRIDEWPDAFGEFGRAPTNPIPVNRAIGEMIYLSHLRWNGQPVVFCRIGSIAVAIDMFQVISLDGSFHDLLYLDMYHRYPSKKVPAGYTWSETIDGITGIPEADRNFPRSLDGIYELAKHFFGVPVVSPLLSKFNAKAALEAIEKSNGGDANEE